jgi:hypothetical protein
MAFILYGGGITKYIVGLCIFFPFFPPPPPPPPPPPASFCQHLSFASKWSHLFMNSFSWIKLLCLASFVLISIQLILFLFNQLNGPHMSCYLSLIALSSTTIQAPHVQITLKRRHPTNFTADDHWILHQVHVLGGLCLIGDPSTLLIPDTQWNLQSPMEEVFYFFFPSDGSPLGSIIIFHHHKLRMF